MSDSALSLIVGLGNPGAKYRDTRHNVGFWFVDALASGAGASFRSESRFQGELCQIEVDGHVVRLLKPTTYMNRSGMSVRALSAFYRLPIETILVVHDDLDLSPGVVRFKRSGGHGGHNGLRDLIAQLGDRDFRRLRVGIGHPGPGNDVVSYVLRRPPGEELNLIEDSLDRALREVPLLLSGQFGPAMNTLHRRAG